jgi:hypothetical protein
MDVDSDNKDFDVVASQPAISPSPAASPAISPSPHPFGPTIKSLSINGIELTDDSYHINSKNALNFSLLVKTDQSDSINTEIFLRTLSGEKIIRNSNAKVKAGEQTLNSTLELPEKGFYFIEIRIEDSNLNTYEITKNIYLNVPDVFIDHQEIIPFNRLRPGSTFIFSTRVMNSLSIPVENTELLISYMGSDQLIKIPSLAEESYNTYSVLATLPDDASPGNYQFVSSLKDKSSVLDANNYTYMIFDSQPIIDFEKIELNNDEILPGVTYILNDSINLDMKFSTIHDLGQIKISALLIGPESQRGYVSISPVLENRAYSKSLELPFNGTPGDYVLLIFTDADGLDNIIKTFYFKKTAPRH